MESGSSAGDFQDDPDLPEVPDLEEMDLLGEIFDTLSSQSSREPGLLYSTRSLDLFNSALTTSPESLAMPSQESLNLSICNSGSLMSWEDGPELEGEGPEDSINQSERKEPSGERMCVDLGRLVDNFTDLGAELKEELSDLRLLDGKWVESIKQCSAEERHRTKEISDDKQQNHFEEKENLEVPAQMEKELEEPEASLEPQGEPETSGASLEEQRPEPAPH